jgi:hypothetical protein
MGSKWLNDIGAALSGLPVNYYKGWESRSRSSGGFDAILAIGIHHTASSASPESDMKYMWETCPDKPVGNIYLARDGKITVGAAGASNTMGKGGPLHCTGGTIGKDAGNKYMIAIEAANAGTGEPWPAAQTDMYVQLVRKLCGYYRLHVGQDVYGHYDYCAPSCPGRKIDPAGPSPFGSVNSSGTWDINKFRSAVNSEPTPAPGPGPGPSPIPLEGSDMLIRFIVDDGKTPLAQYVTNGVVYRHVPDQAAADALVVFMAHAGLDSEVQHCKKVQIGWAGIFVDASGKIGAPNPYL